VFEAMPAWIPPAYPFVVLGPLAGVLLYSQPKTSAIPILISGIMFQGLGWTIALIMYTIYFTRLINSDIPKEPKRAGMYIAVSPAGMWAALISFKLFFIRIDSSPTAYTASTLVTLGT
jgi:tellurite resistance protein TehA-like permease